jgi:hypothetical protein
MGLRGVFLSIESVSVLRSKECCCTLVVPSLGQRHEDANPTKGLDTRINSTVDTCASISTYCIAYCEEFVILC